jgi:site-specific DNA recombinase
MEQSKAVGIWIRVSTEDQAKGESPEHHERRARLYAESKGWEVTTVYHLEGLSGKSVMGYPETKRMLADIKKGTITGLIFSKLARLARNTKELLDFSDIFKHEEADLISLQEAIDTSTPAGRFFYTMIAAMAEWERGEISDRITASIPIRAKLNKSLGGKPPFGYKWENKVLVIDEQYAPVRKLIYELFLKYRRKKVVAKHLNDAGYRSQGGKLFSDMTINQLLRDPTAKGERRVNYSTRTSDRKKMQFKPASEWCIHPCPALVSTDVWDQCNKILDDSLIKNKKPGPRAKHLLAGFVHCADCEKKMYVFHTTKSPTYRCSSCKNRIVTEDIEEIYHDQLKAFLLTGVSVSEYMQKIDSELQEKQKLLSVISSERDLLSKKIDTFIQMRMNNELSKEMFAEKYKPMEERISQLADQLPELEADVAFLKIQYLSSDVILTDANDLYSKWHTLSFEDKRAIVETITDKIVVGKEDIHIKLAYLPTTNQAQTADPIPNLNPVNKQSNL